MIHRKSLVVIIIGCFLLISQISADPKKPVELENMLVTDREMRSDILLSRPLSATVFDQRTLDERIFTSVQDIADAVPNLNIMDSGTRSFADVTGIRGLINTPFFSAPSTLVYVDGIPYGGAFTYANQLFGIESVEVLRGPQGASFGKNSYAGVINVKSRQPKNQWVSRVSVGRGNFDYWTGDGYTSGALIPDELYFTLAGAYAQRDGYLKNNFLNNRPDDQEQLSGRASLKWTPLSHWDIRLSASIDDFRDGSPRWVLLTDASRITPLSDVSFDTNSDLNGKIEQTTDSQSLRIAYTGNAYEFLAITTRRSSDINPLLVDNDFSPLPIAMVMFQEDQQQWTQEFRLQSTGPADTWDWSTGIFASTSEISGFRNFTFFGADDSFKWSNDEENYALFGQLNYNALAPIHILASLRLDYYRQHFQRQRPSPPMRALPIDQRNEYFFASPQITLDYALSDQATVYLTSSLSFKPGGYSAGADTAALAEFDREQNWANEIGFKWANDKARASLAAFFYQIKDYQVERFFSPVDFLVANASKVNSYGAEAELNAEVWDGVTLEGAFGYTHIEFEEYTDPITGTDFDGNKAPYTPEFNLLLAAQYRNPLGIFARVEGVWTGETYFDDQNSDLIREGKYTLLNARLGFESKGFSAIFYGNNLTDTEYYSYKIRSALTGIPGEPRTYGVKLSLEF